MLALARIPQYFATFRRHAAQRTPLRLGVPRRVAADSGPAGVCPPEAAGYRVTDTLRRWHVVWHFAHIEGAAHHAAQTGGVVWERYTGPTGATNWWSLGSDECAARLAARHAGAG